ncbi:glycosyltransferase family 2 protein [Thermodesulfobacteriota bacterium]
MTKSDSQVTLLIPCFNEEETISEFYRRVDTLSQKLSTYDFEFLFINDGSKDNTASILNHLAVQDRRVKVLHLARNQGHQIAVTAGLDYATGDATVIIDADLQDPPELVEEMLKKIKEGYDVVHAQRRRRSGETWFKLFSAKLYYRLFQLFANREIVRDSGDFRAITRPVLKAARAFREPHRFLRGIFSLIGFKQCIIQYDRDIRFAGKTKYPLRKMLLFALNGILSFSTSPIRFIIYSSLMLWSLSLIYLLRGLYQHFVLGITIKGWTSLIFLQSFYTGLILFSIGIVGAYVGRIFEQGQNRPLYWLQDVRNIDISQLAQTGLKCRERNLSADILNNCQQLTPGNAADVSSKESDPS